MFVWVGLDMSINS